MTSIDSILQKAANPFDPATFKPGNFWQETQADLTVESIHQEVLSSVEAALNQVAADHKTRSLMLLGDSGAGKSHLLGRLKQTLNPNAFFVYIGPWADSTFIWRHTLRQTVDSLIQVPEGQQESQLLLWLKSLSIFKKKSFLDWLEGDRKRFIRQLRESYKSGIYNANEFFGVLYDLLNPDLHLIACDWLKGDDLDEEDLQSIRVKKSIDSEDAAQKILENFGRISVETQPIVLCFDNLDGIPRAADGFIDLQTLFNVNSTIHNEKLQNFLIIISIITNTWIENSKRVQPADRARIDQSISLKPIHLDQAEGLWKLRLRSLHQQATPLPDSPIYPLTRNALEEKIPGGKTYPRVALELGRRLFVEYKTGRPIENDPIAIFKLVWLKELQKTQQKLARIRQLSSPELVQMLREVMVALGMEDVRSRFLPSPTYFIYSFSYQTPGDGKRIGVVWTEEPNLTSFYHIMNACQKALQVKLCDGLRLVRSESCGKKTSKGYKLYQEIFERGGHLHVTPTLESVQMIATYYSLVNAARARDLMIGGKVPSADELAAIVREAKVLQECGLLQDLGVVPKKFKPIKKTAKKGASIPEEAVEDFLFNFVKINGFLGMQTLIQNARNQYPQLTESAIYDRIQQLCQSGTIQLLDPNAPPEAQLVCLVPDASRRA